MSSSPGDCVGCFMARSHDTIYRRHLVNMVTIFGGEVGLNHNFDVHVDVFEAVQTACLNVARQTTAGIRFNTTKAAIQSHLTPTSSMWFSDRRASQPMTDVPVDYT